MGKGSTGAAAGGGAIYGLGIFGALSYLWQQADSLGDVWGDLPEGDLLARVDGPRGVSGRSARNGGSPLASDPRSRAARTAPRGA
jgi:hypothetical protein